MVADKNKVSLELSDGIRVDAFAPIIVSASRATDIPAFYSDWFFHRLKEGYSAWTNPFNGKTSYVSYQNTRFIVFWSKNPEPLLKHFDYLESRKIGFYIQYTLNDYESEGLERGVPPLQQRIDTFKHLVDKLGLGRVIWRFDPMILTNKITMESLLNKIQNIGDQLKNYTEKLVFSYADIASYRKVKSNLEKNAIKYLDWNESMMEELALKLAELNKAQDWNYQLATCCEKIDIERFGIEHNRCVDDELMIRFAWNDAKLMKFLNVEIQQVESSLFGETEIPEGAIKIDENRYAIKKKNNRDKGQRQFCGCIASKDIGQYNTCPHLCEYCYANASKNLAITNWERHKNNPTGEKIL